MKRFSAKGAFEMSVLHMELGTDGYDITVERGALQRAGELFKLDRKVLIATDDGVPFKYSDKMANFCKDPCVVTLPQGEQNKCMTTYMRLLEKMVENNFTRND